MQCPQNDEGCVASAKATFAFFLSSRSTLPMQNKSCTTTVYSVLLGKMLYLSL